MPIGPYYADFLCRERRLVVEIDGYSHDVRVEHDGRRDRFLREAGYHVLRFSNADVHERVQGVVEIIAAALEQKPHPQPLPPAGGEQ